MRPLKEMIDQFGSEGVLGTDNSCDFACPLIIVNKKDGRIRMAVDYREVNMQLEPTANQLPYQPSQFQRDSSKVTAIITPWWYIAFCHVHLVSQPRVNTRQGWRTRF